MTAPPPRRRMRALGWAVILGVVLALCGTAVACVALGTHQASVADIQKAGGELVGAIVLMVLGVAFFAE